MILGPEAAFILG